MSAVAELVGILIAQGVSPVNAASLVARAGAEMSVVAPSKGALRTRKYRAAKASQTVTNRHTVTPVETTPETSQSVTERHKASQCDNAILLTSLDSIEQEKKVRGTKRARMSPIPDGWTIPDRARPIAAELGVDIDRVAERFLDYLASSGKLYANYDAGFCNYVRNTPKFNGPMKPPDKPISASLPGFYAQPDSPELDAWDAYHRATKGRNATRDRNGGWRFPTQWPPGHQTIQQKQETIAA